MPDPWYRRRILPRRSRDIEEEIDAELGFHLEMRERDYLVAGMTPAEAKAAARARLGDLQAVASLLREHDTARLHREQRTEMTQDLLQDIRHGARQLRLHPWLTTGIVLVLAVGIGAATTMFSAVDAVLLRPLPFADDERLVMLPTVNIPTEGSVRREKAFVELDDVRAMDGVQTAAAYAPGGLNLGATDRPRRARVALVTPDFFRTVGVQPRLGRAMLDEEGRVDAPRVAIVSHAVWRRELGGEAAAIGRRILLNGVSHEVIGVMPPEFGYPLDTELWVPLRLPFQFADMEAFARYLPSAVIARLEPGTSPRVIGERIVAESRALRPDARDSDFTAERAAVVLREDIVGERRTQLLVLFGATGFVLLIACANATHLLLARAAVRKPEFTLRAALGATRGRLVRQLLVESSLLALMAGALGVVIAPASLNAVDALLPAGLAGVSEPRLDARVLGFSVALAMITGLAFGLAPAWGASRTDTAETLKVAGGWGSTGLRGARTRRVLVVGEVALALVLAVGSGLMLRTLHGLLANELGLEPMRVATAELSLPGVIYDSPAARRRFHDELLGRLSSVPGVDGAALSTRLPLSRGPGSGALGYSITAEGRAPGSGDSRVMAEATHVSADYFRAMGIPLKRGRPARARRDSIAMGEIVIGESAARTLWPGDEPLGARVGVSNRETRVVVGVVGDVRSWSIDEPPDAQIYLPIEDAPPSHVVVIARGALRAEVLAGRVQDAVRSVDALQPVYNVRTMEQVVSTALGERRTTALLITTFGVIALVLAAVGVYGVLAYGVAQRRREIGIRMALGARASDVVRLILREGVLLAVIGVSLGFAGAWALRRVMESLVYGVTPSDPLTFGAATVALLAVAILAALIPARRAARVDAAEAMRV